MSAWCQKEDTIDKMAKYIESHFTTPTSGIKWIKLINFSQIILTQFVLEQWRRIKSRYFDMSVWPLSRITYGCPCFTCNITTNTMAVPECEVSTYKPHTKIYPWTQSWVSYINFLFSHLCKIYFNFTFLFPYRYSNWRFPNKILYAFFVSPILVTYQSKHSLIDFTVLIIFRNILSRVGGYAWRKWRVLIRMNGFISTSVTISLLITINTVLSLIYTLSIPPLHTH
jgi:hypothetical protein